MDNWIPDPPARRISGTEREGVSYFLCSETALWWAVLTPLRRANLDWDMVSLIELLSEQGEEGMVRLFRRAVDVEALPAEILRELREGAVEARKLPIWGEDHRLDLQALKAWLGREETLLGAAHQRLLWKQAIREGNRRKAREEEQ